MNYRKISDYKNTIKEGIRKTFEYKIDFNIALWAKSFSEGIGEALYSLQGVVKSAFLMLFPQNSTGEFLDMWGEWEGLEKKTGNEASGTVTFVDDAAGETVEFGTLMQGTNGLVYETTESGDIAYEEYTVSDFYIADGFAYVETYGVHGFATGQKPIHDLDSGVGEVVAENGITVTSDTEYYFEIDMDEITGVTGTVYDYMVTLDVVCQEVGEDGNIETGTLNIIEDVDISEECYVNEEIKNGVDPETTEDYRARIMLSRSQMRGVFTNTQITIAALEIEGNTRLVIDNPVPGEEDSPKVAGFQPRPGETVVYVIRDTDSGIESPVDSDILDETREAILENGKLPAHVSEDDVYVFSPLLYDVDITLEISPDTSTMREAVEESLGAYFFDKEEFDSDSVTIEGITAAIENTFDFETGDTLESFTLVSPTSITVPEKNIPQLGDVTYE